MGASVRVGVTSWERSILLRNVISLRRCPIINVVFRFVNGLRCGHTVSTTVFTSVRVVGGGVHCYVSSFGARGRAFTFPFEFCGRHFNVIARSAVMVLLTKGNVTAIPDVKRIRPFFAFGLCLVKGAGRPILIRRSFFAHDGN